jgi:hypothetical protein
MAFTSKSDILFTVIIFCSYVGIYIDVTYKQCNIIHCIFKVGCGGRETLTTALTFTLGAFGREVARLTFHVFYVNLPRRTA